MEGLSLNMFFFCMNIYNNIIVTARLLQGWGGGGGMLPGENYMKH